MIKKAGFRDVSFLYRFFWKIAGFRDVCHVMFITAHQVVASDKSGLMVEVLKKELDKFVAIKEKFVDEFSLEDFEYIDEVRIGQ